MRNDHASVETILPTICACRLVTCHTYRSLVSSFYFCNHFSGRTGLGVGAKILVTVVLERFRVVERLRLFFYKTWDDKVEAPLRVPRKIVDHATDDTSADDEEGNKVVVECQYGSIYWVVSPKIAPSSKLHMALVIIRPGCELTAARAASLEMYQVLSGSGRVSQQGISETFTISTGDLWMVDPGSFRWISNRDSKTADLVLVRTVDANIFTYNSANSAVNCIHVDPNRRTTTVMDRFRESVTKFHQMASSYVTKSQ